jgi:hypothetical protein
MNLLNGFKWLLNPLWIVNTFFICKLDDDDTPAPQQITQTTTNIPDYAQPYVENMLGATQQQLFNMDSNGQISGLKAYTPYSTNMNDYVAGFSPLQQQAQRSAGNLYMPGQFGQGSQFAAASGLGSLGTAQTAAGAGNNYYNMATNPNAINAFMNPYMQNVLSPQLDEIRRQYDITGTQQQSAATGVGAFGGSREALMAAENKRNMGTTMNQAIGSAYDKAFQQAQQAQQYGAGLGLQGQQAALQGYNQAGQAGAQNQIGAQQTAAEQAKINQAIQDYATAQQYPLMQLGFMSNMTRGLPLSAPTTSMYQAQPSAGTQAIGMAGALGSLGAAAPKAAKGGIMSYDIGGSVEYDLARMPTDKLNELKQSAQSKIEKAKIDKILAERKLDDTPQFAPGGIVAFKVGDKVMSDDERAASEAYQNWEKTAADYNPSPASVKDYDPAKTVLNEYGISNTNMDDSHLTLGRTAPINTTRDRLNEIAAAGNYSNGLNWQDQLKKPTPAIVKEPVNDMSARAAAWQLANAKPTPQAAAPAGPNQGIKAVGSQPAGNNAETTVDDYADAKKAVTQLQDLDTQLANKLRDTYKNPELAPYAKARFDQFQDEIDHAKEKDRQMFWLHSATMFATMATQPGGIIKAAMGALAQQIPLYVKDKEAQEKHLEDLKKAQYDITQSEIARRVGDIKTSMELKQNALKTSADIYKDIFKNKSDVKRVEAEIKHWGAMEDIGKESNKVQMANVNKPSAEERIIERSMLEPKFAEAASTLKGAGPEARKYASDEGLYKAAIAAGRISDVPTDTNYMSFDDYRSGSVHGKNKFAGFTDKSNYK